MRGLTGSAARIEALRLADVNQICWQRVYKITEDLRPKRKRRSDAGKRSYDLAEGSDIWTAAQLVVADKLDPDQALLTVRTRKPGAVLPSLSYFQKILRENNLGRKSRRSPKRAFRRWEASQPGELFQIDVTALKVRWQDEKTRRILRIEGVDKNHPQMDPTKLRVWQILLKDDYSRRTFLRYIVARAITSTEMVRFMCEAYTALCVPLTLYTDQGGEFKGRHIHAAKILNAVLKNDGGYIHMPHAAGNAQATGKVENGHQWAEKMDRLVGLAVTEGQHVTIETLNIFADRVCGHYDNRVHRSTNETPIARWHGKRIVVRKLPTEIIESALLSQEFEVALDPSMTVTYDKVAYKIPGVQPFVNYVGEKVKVVVPPNIDLILLTLPDGSEFEVEKILAAADKAGEFRSVADSTSEDITKRLKASRREEIKSIKAQKRLTGQIEPVPHYNVVIEQPATNIANFPHAERVVTAEEIAAVTSIPAQLYTGKPLDYWQAVAEFKNRFAGGVVEAKEFLLGIFPNTEGELPAGEIESAIDSRFDSGAVRHLRAV